jgi:hypothetical protein
VNCDANGGFEPAAKQAQSWSSSVLVRFTDQPGGRRTSFML